MDKFITFMTFLNYISMEPPTEELDRLTSTLALEADISLIIQCSKKINPNISSKEILKIVLDRADFMYDLINKNDTIGYSAWLDDYFIASFDQNRINGIVYNIPYRYRNYKDHIEEAILNNVPETVSRADIIVLDTCVFKKDAVSFIYE